MMLDIRYPNRRRRAMTTTIKINGSDRTVDVGTINKEFASAIGMSFVECRGRDNGPGKANTRPRRGLKILEAPAKSLGGTIDQCCGPHAATAVLLFPAEFGSAERLA